MTKEEQQVVSDESDVDSKPTPKPRKKPNKLDKEKQKKKLAKMEKKYPFLKVPHTSKAYEAVLAFGIENLDHLREWDSRDTFPVGKYHTLETKMDKSKKEDDEKRKAPFNTGKSGKLIIQFLCSRAILEMHVMLQEYEDSKKDPNFKARTDPKTDDEIKEWFLSWMENSDDFDFSVMAFVINAVDNIPIKNRVKNSQNMEAEFFKNINPLFSANAKLSFYVAERLTEFLKIVGFYFSNLFWFDTSKTIGERNFRTLISFLYTFVPNHSAKTLDGGMMDRIDEFLKDSTEKKKKKKKEEEEKDDDDDSDSSSDEEEKPKKKKKKDKKKKDKKKKDKKTKRNVEESEPEPEPDAEPSEPENDAPEYDNDEE